MLAFATIYKHNQTQAMPRKKHPKKEVEAALSYAEERGFTIEIGGSHAWGKLYCPHNDKECRCGEFCITSIWSTPKNSVNHARQIKRVIDHCTHRSGHETNED